MAKVPLLDSGHDVSFLSQFKKIVVSGPQRSGTTYAARALAHTLGHQYVDEDAIKVRDADLLDREISSGGFKVIQAPGCSFLLHKLSGDGVAVVWVRRPLCEIILSQERVSWSSEDVEIRQYEILKSEGDQAVRRPPANVKGSAEYKIWAWENWQSSACCVPCFELLYHGSFLIEHHLYVGDRASFGVRQWSRR